jgi:stearoyl-CoA desaturase (delta-9 desaturase)
MNKMVCDAETLQAVIAHRYEIVTTYAKTLKSTCKEEIAKLRQNGTTPLATMREGKAVRSFREWLRSDVTQLSDEHRESLQATLKQSNKLETIYTLRLDLAKLWERSTLSKEELVARLEEWCKRAEATGIAQLQQFSRQLRSYA